jgi:hypothetical protein
MRRSSSAAGANVGSGVTWKCARPSAVAEARLGERTALDGELAPRGDPSAAIRR